MLEREVENKVELPSKEEIERVSYCVGTYLSAFSKEPFDEKWSINGEKSSAFLLNPKTTGEFVNEIFQQDDVEFVPLADGSEQVKVRKELILEHIERTLKNPLTKYLSSDKGENWISEEEIIELSVLRKSIEEAKGDFVDVHIPYPLTSVVESYLDAIKDPVSMVFLGCQEGEDFENIKFLRIQSDTEIPEGISPRVVCRYITSNHPRFEAKQNVQDRIINEVGYYLSEEDKEKVKEAVDPDAYTIFFGELAKIPTSSKIPKMMDYSRDKYFEILITTLGDVDAEFDNIADLIPTQMIFFSVRGTSVLLDGKSGGTKLFSVAKGLLKDRLNLDYEENDPPLIFQNSNNQEVVVGIIKRVEEKKS